MNEEAKRMIDNLEPVEPDFSMLDKAKTLSEHIEKWYGMDKKLKVFEIKSNGERIWICAYTNIAALKFWLNQTDETIHDYSDADEIIEVPEHKWPDYKIYKSDDETETTFDEYMKKQTTTDIICGTPFFC